MTQMDLQYAGEFTVSEIELISSSGSALDIKETVIQIDIFEDIFDSTIFGALSVADTNDLIHNMPILGQEFLKIKLKTPNFTDDDEIIDHVFSVVKIDKSSEVSQGSRFFQISFTSMEFLKNSRIRISKSFTGTASEIVKDLLENEQYIGTKKNINIEETVGIKKVVSPNLNPYKLIRNLLAESIAKNSNSPHFLFYETLKGINFRTVQSLYNQSLSGTFDAGVALPTNFVKTRVIDDVRRVIMSDQSTHNDMIFNIKSGMMGSNLIMHDIYNKNYQTYNFGYFNNFDDFDRIDDNPIYNEVSIDNFDNTVGDFPESKLYVHPTSTTTDFKDAQHYNTSNDEYSYVSNKIQETLQHRRAKYVELMGGIGISVSIHGHTALQAGQMVEFARETTSKKIDDGVDKYINGRFLIRTLRHTFSNSVKKHEISMVLIKDSYPSEHPSYASGKPPIQKRGVTTNLTVQSDAF